MMGGGSGTTEGSVPGSLLPLSSCSALEGTRLAWESGQGPPTNRCHWWWWWWGPNTQRDFNVSRLAGAENAQTVHAGLATLTMLQ